MTDSPDEVQSIEDLYGRVDDFAKELVQNGRDAAQVAEAMFGVGVARKCLSDGVHDTCRQLSVTALGIRRLGGQLATELRVSSRRSH